MNALDWSCWSSCSPTPSPATGRASSPAPSRPSGCCSAASSGIWLAPRLLGDARPGGAGCRSAALFVVLVCASFGQAILQFAGARIRDADPVAAGPRPRRRRRRGAQHGRRAGRRLGARRRGQRRRAAVGHQGGARLRDPRPGRRRDADRARCEALNSFNDVVGLELLPALPRAVRAGAHRRRRAAAAADRARPRRRARRRPSVLKIRGENDCGRGVEGTGFLYAPGRVMTNAHVVAGVDTPRSCVDGRGRAPGHGRLLQPRPRRRGARRRRPRPAEPLRFDHDGQPRTGRRRCWATRRTARTTCRRPGSAAEQRLRSPDIYGDGHRRARGLLAARAGPPGQLRRPAGLRGRPACSAWSSPRR